ncbi:MAG: hypothetical protein WKG07_32335 [Hymenobacter sp.]
MSTSSASDSADRDPRPAGQQDRAATAHLNPNEPATQAEAGTPAYGDFGKADETEPAVPSAGNDGSNDNPDEFSEFRKSDDQPTTSQNPGYQPNGSPMRPAPARSAATPSRTRTPNQWWPPRMLMPMCSAPPGPMTTAATPGASPTPPGRK